MDSTTQTVLIVAVAGILAKLVLGGKADKTDIQGLIKKGAMVIDTRTAGEFSHGHIEGALNIPYNAIGQKIGAHTADKSKQIIVYCHSGARSSAAKKTLIGAGFTNVVNGGSLHHMRKTLSSD